MHVMTGSCRPININASCQICSYREFLDEFRQDIVNPTKSVSFRQHLFTAYWQFSQYKHLQTPLRQGKIIFLLYHYCCCIYIVYIEILDQSTCNFHVFIVMTTCILHVELANTKSINLIITTSKELS